MWFPRALVRKETVDSEDSNIIHKHSTKNRPIKCDEIVYTNTKHTGYQGYT